MSKKIDELLTSVHSPEATSPRRKAIKESVMDAFNEQDNAPQKGGVFNGWAPKLTAGGAILVVAAVFGFSTFVAGPLTAKEVLAQASEYYEEAGQSKGRYLYNKVRQVSVVNGVEDVSIGEFWLDTETNDSKSINRTEEGEVLDIFIEVDGETYSYINKEAYAAQSEELGLDITTPAGFYGEIEGLKEAGLTEDDLFNMVMKDFDDALEAAGFPRYHEEIYGTRDFPAYTMTPEEIEAHAEAILGDPEEMDSIALDLNKIEELNSIWPEDAFGGIPDDFEIPSEEDQQAAANFGSKIEELMKSSSTQERLKLIEELGNDDSVTLTDEIEWEGMNVIGVSFNEDAFGTSILYFRTDTYQMAGTEASFSFNGETSEDVFRAVVLEETFSNERPDFSTDGLEQFDASLNTTPVSDVLGEDAPALIQEAASER